VSYAVIGHSSFSGGAFFAHLLRTHPRMALLGLSRPHFDLNKYEAFDLKDVLKQNKPEIIVNFAALNMVGESWKHAQDYYRTNVLGVTRLADWLAGQKWLKKFVQVSTPEVYGATLTQLDETAPFSPSTPYAVSRAAADMHLQALHREYGFPVCFTRSVNVYGPRQQPYRLIPKTVLKILRGEKLQLHGGGRSERSFLHVDDMAEAIRLVAENGKPGATYHAAGSQLIEIRQVVQNVANELGASLSDVIEETPERPGKDPAYWLNDSKIRNELGWSPQIPFFGDGLTKTIQWFRTNAYRYESLEYEHRA
jgi:dTDP-glucose 4,6-dehydratase